MNATAHLRQTIWPGWIIGLGLALVVNLLVPLLLSRLSHREQRVDAPLITRRLVRPPEPEANPVAPMAGKKVAAPPTQPTQPPLPALDLPPIPHSNAAITIPAMSAVADLGALPLVMPAVAIAGAATGDATLAVPVTTDDIQPPHLLSAVDLERFYPRAARLRGTTGQTVIQLSITAEGAVSAVTVLRSMPSGVFERSAEDLGRTQRFLPARQGGKPIATTLSLTLNWTVER